MANRKATFAKRQRETALKERALAKDARRAQLRNESPGTKGPQIAWDEAVRATTSNELPSLSVANEGRGANDPPVVTPGEPPLAPEASAGGAPVTSPDPAAHPGAARSARP